MKTRVAIVASFMAVCLLSALTVYAADVKGMIKARAGDTMVVSTASGDVTIMQLQRAAGFHRDDTDERQHRNVRLEQD